MNGTCFFFKFFDGILNSDFLHTFTLSTRFLKVGSILICAPAAPRYKKSKCIAPRFTFVHSIPRWHVIPVHGRVQTSEVGRKQQNMEVSAANLTIIGLCPCEVMNIHGQSTQWREIKIPEFKLLACLKAAIASKDCISKENHGIHANPIRPSSLKEFGGCPYQLLLVLVSHVLFISNRLNAFVLNWISVPLPRIPPLSGSKVDNGTQRFSTGIASSCMFCKYESWGWVIDNTHTHTFTFSARG